VLEAIEYIRKLMRDIEPYQVYFALRKMRLRHIRNETIDVVRACIACHNAGLTQFSTTLIRYVLGRSYSITRIMHTLGDKHVLTFIRTSSRDNVYCLNPVFKQHIAHLLHQHVPSTQALNKGSTIHVNAEKEVS